MAAHRVPYCATVSLAHPDDALRKMRHALDLSGFRFLHVLSPCPTGWKSEPSQGIELVRLAVRSGFYPVIEVREGRALTINVEPDLADGAMERYFKLQGRFRRSVLDFSKVRGAVERNWRDLRARASAAAAPAAVAG